MRTAFFVVIAVVAISYPLATVSDFASFGTPKAEVLFVGDIMFDRSVREVAEREGNDFIFSCIANVFNRHDAVVANLEGPITHFSSKSIGSVIGSPENYTFTFPLSLAQTLRRHNVRAVSLGNNHTSNFGREGVEETRAALESAGVAYFGDPFDFYKTSTLLRVHGVSFVLVSFNEFGGSVKDTLSHIRAWSDTVPVIVFAHWGNEYEETSAARQREWARQFVDAGADLVVGAHPHVIQESEEYKGVPIYYSLGNFIMDQYWMESVRTGLVLSVVLTKDGVEKISEQKVELRRDRRTCLVE
ncbi:hypothetical protein COU17_02695 [Candidatus Kaiserbacteria bacterium CG10_big_fil_rev_8_21_14_0_10_49_17]|uniref:Capsule synthesis protein CapA domain-containing protein n=1 Tax=Candidatus Kaiserbacteria bacterium CG10_big_fil_rev_8_21_14_0_10_49_17 TaxID=1974609 RepID=A0A2M6WE22_9BACT|nr:MAG: hypothetical protein COU17_02695 [Candidatus Kaiserbacteria bacterium CG10_big_fil_rev_8_21_14_0_10_49_17]